MSTPLHGIAEEGLSSNVSTVDRISLNSSEPKERNYMGLPDSSSDENSVLSSLSDGKKSNLNLKATELTLGLPGSRSPERHQELCLLSSGRLDEIQLFPLLPSSSKTALSGNKRGFSDAMHFSSKKNCSDPGVQSTSVKENSESQPCLLNDGSHTISECGPSNNTSNNLASKAQLVTWPPVKSSTNSCISPAAKTQVVGWPPLKSSNNISNPPAAKAQVVGWPPIRSFRKNTLATTSKNNDEVDGKPGPGPLYVKVSMDGAPYLRKIDLRSYSSYQELSSALEKMFTRGQCGSHGAQESEMQSERKVRDLLNGSEDVLTYEDKDGDWMLVGDVPWE
ncbi:hypothetical protein C5167_017613 [Papaver somniferum]|uniref:Auxin-responsive protein n=1 Tax=Papaver somniferum TaxID=3469 RepID=A0A4Y7IM42_PAPSO|nr:hypothetical protein C5167_017613 [Papaver somniferum]